MKLDSWILTRITETRQLVRTVRISALWAFTASILLHKLVTQPGFPTSASSSTCIVESSTVTKLSILAIILESASVFSSSGC